MKAKFNRILVGFSITFAIILSLRIVWIPTPLNLMEQIGIISMMFDYTMKRSKELEVKDETGR